MTDKKTYFKQCVVTVLLLLSLTGVSQSPKVISFVNEDGVYLRWQGLHSESLEGYNVYRQSESSTAWELLNEVPLQLITDNSIIKEIAAYKAGIFLQLFGINDINSDLSREAYLNVIADPQAVSFMEVMSLVNPKLGYLLGEIYHDSTALRGQTYRYRMNAIVNGNESEIGFSEIIDPNKIQSVPTASGLVGDGLDKMNRMQWERNRNLLSSGELVTYRLYRSESLLGLYQQVNYYGILPVQVTTGSNTSTDNEEEYLDKFLTNGLSYYYHVKGVNAFGFESKPGITVQVTTGADLLPDPPQNVRAALLGMNLKLEWDERKNVSGYEVYRSVQKTDEYSLVYQSGEIPEKPFWIDVQIDPGSTYYYYILSLKDKLKSATSDTLVFTFNDMNPPSAPLNVSAISDSSGVILSWNANSEADIKGYEIERAADDEFISRMLLNTFVIPDTFYVDNVSNKSQTTYAYVVYAVDSMDNRSLPSEMVKARMPDVVAPQVPIITGLKRTGKQVRLTWTEAVEKDLKLYKVSQAIGQNEMRLIGETEEPIYQFELDESGKYSFAVQTVDEAGNESPFSEIYTLTYDADEFPPPPLGLGISVNDKGHVVLSWDTPDYDDLKGFYVMRTDMINGNVRDFGQFSNETNAYTDRFVEKGRKYQYMVKTYNSKWYFSTPEYQEIEIEDEE